MPQGLPPRFGIMDENAGWLVYEESRHLTIVAERMLLRTASLRFLLFVTSPIAYNLTTHPFRELLCLIPNPHLEQSHQGDPLD